MALNTETFVQGLIDGGVSHVCVVPCSFAKYLINELINNDNIEYVACASEAVACSIAAGLRLAGKMPMVIAQSSGLTNMGSCITSLLKPYGVRFPILVSWRTYAEGDSEIQHQHLATNLPDLILAYGYDYEILNSDNLEASLLQIEQFSENLKLGVIKSNTFKRVDLLPKHQLDWSQYTPRSEFLMCMNQALVHDDVIFIGTTGNTAREMYNYMPDSNNFYMAGNMGGALSLGLGAAKAGNKVVVCGGDAEFAMHMGGMVTVGRYASSVNIIYVLFDNDANKSTGGQHTYQKHVDYIGIAMASGFHVVRETIYDAEVFVFELNQALSAGGAHFMHVKCGIDPETPRPPLAVVRKNSF